MQPMTRSALRCDDHVYHSLSNLMEFGTNKPRSVFHLLLSNKSKVCFELHGRLNLALARAAPPSAPTITSLISTYSDQLTVTWTYAPTATRYNVSINDSVNTLVPILSTGAPQYTFTGLTNNTVYSVSVVAINCAGSSSPATITTRTKQSMAGIRIEPPEPLVFAKPDGLPQCKRRFEQFIIASGVSEESELRKVSTLLYCLGPDAEDVLVSTNINSEERNKYCDVVKKLDDFFKVRRNVIFERARFNRRSQLDGETVDQYIAVLHNLAENCDYGMLKSELIRDRIVVGIRDSALSQRLQLDPDLTLEKAMRVARQREAVQEQQEILREAADSKELDSTVIKHKQQLQTGQSHLSRCLCCGRDHHQNGRCPARAATLGCQELKTSSKILYGPGKQPLDVMGQFVAKITFKNAHSQEPIFVVRGLNSNLLGLPALRALQLVARTDAISQYEEQIYQKYPHLFTGLGTLGPEYTIKLKANALPYALSMPRSVPLPLRDKVKKELDRMESMRVISRVDGPSEMLPFGISCAPELFQKRMSDILQDIEGKLCQMDDVLVFGSSQEEHDDRLKAVLKRIEEAGMRLNPDKCAFSRHQVKFLGHIVDQRGIQADPEKTSAILKLPTPKNIAELRRLLGMVNQFGKFSPHIAEITKPLRELLSSRNGWLWGSKHDEAFLKLKKEVTKPSILAHYNPQCEVKISADASSFGLGAALLQKENNEWRPVAFASRRMTETEQRYAQIENEALAIIWACDKFSCFGERQKNPLVVEPMISLELPAYPWQRISEVIQLPSTTTSTKVISVLKSVFARHGIPEEFISDNGPQYSSQEMKEFALQYGFRHTTSSPHYPRDHGQAERAVKTVKSLLLDAEDPFLALLNYRATPFPWCGLSPAELLFGRQIHTTLPQAVSQLTPHWAHLKQFRIKEQQFKCRQKADYDRRHRTWLLSDLQHNTEFRVATEKKLTKGHVLSKANTPRSYIIETPDGRTLRRNRHHLMVVPRGEELYELQDEQDGSLEHNDNDEQEEGTANGPDPEEPAEKEVKDAAVPVLERRHIRTRSPIATRSRTGTAIRPPDRL
eukprot:Em0005g336a